MADLNLSFVSAVNERTRPIMDGSVRPEGIQFTSVVSDPSETFWRMLRFGDFDVSEMSISSYLIVKAQGADLVAIPAFPSRRFMHTEYLCHVDSGINGPEDLVGKRVGVGEYQQTAAVWSRGIFQHDFGVSQYDVDWYMERAPEQSHGAATGFTPPDGIKFHQVPSDRSLATMLANHELDAASVKRALRKPSNLVERSTRMRVSPEQFKKVTKTVFADPITEGGRFFAAHGFIPVNHTYVIRGELLRQHPWVAINVFKAMIQAKKVAESRIIDSIPLSLVFKEEYMDRTQELLGDDPFPYGLEPNRNALQTLINYSYEQGLTTAKADLDSLFDEEAVAYAAMIGL